MGIFFVLFIFMFIVYLCTLKSGNKHRIVCVVMCVVGAWLVMALRSPWCGVDLYRGVGQMSYFWVFEKVQDCDFLQVVELQYNTGQEVGWLCLNKIVSIISSDFQFFLAVIALFIVGMIGFVIYKYSSNVYLSLLVYYTFGLYHFFFSGLRQGIAVSLTFLSYYFLDKKKYLWYVLLVLLASTMHSSALVFFIAYPVSKINFTPKKSLLLLGGVLCLLPFLSSIVGALTSILFPNRYQHYESGGGAITMFIVYAFIFVISLGKQSEYMEKLRGIILFAVIGQSLGIISSTSMTRIGFYFSVFFSLLIPELVNMYFGKNNRILGTFITSFIFIMFFYLTVKDGYLDVVPYYFFWEKPI